MFSDCTSGYWRVYYPIDDLVMPSYPEPPALSGVKDAAKRHDALARRKYVKPFKWFKFNRARRATAK